MDIVIFRDQGALRIGNIKSDAPERIAEIRSQPRDDVGVLFGSQTCPGVGIFAAAAQGGKAVFENAWDPFVVEVAL